MAQTSLLPPVSAVCMIWARTGLFSNDEYSGQNAKMVEAELNTIRDCAEGDENEKKYIAAARASMDASLRNLEIIYKGRQLNFQENEKLRSAYLDSVNENLDFGNKTKDILKSLPAMSIGGAGSVTIGNFLAEKFHLSSAELWAIGLSFTGIGYIVNLLIIRGMRRRKQMLYVQQDYERSLYYDQYLSRVAVTLTSLYLDLDRIHKNIFGQSYPVEGEVRTIVSAMLEGVRPTFCEYIHKHMREKK
ncbi:MAG: hypothetical protein E3K37_12320 [Candidatus Kuenenia sp.]|nr:hypothetical protein [Candidatus Kuenenia hertensis]